MSHGMLFTASRVALDGEGLLRYSEDHAPKQVTIGPDLLKDLLALARLPTGQGPESILQFVRRWGPLYICRHVLPYTGLPCSLTAHIDCRPEGEPVETWLRLSRWAGAVLGVARCLRVGARPEPVDWAMVCPPALAAHVRGLSMRDVLALQLRVALRASGGGGVAPIWERDELLLSWDFRSAYSAAVHQLLLEARAHRGLAFCANPECREPPFPMDRSTDRYCRVCREDGVPARARLQHFRQKHRTRILAPASRKTRRARRAAERIASAAVKVAGRTFRGTRHKVAAHVAARALGRDPTTIWRRITPRDQGFVTTRGRWLSRPAAWQLAKRRGQIRRDRLARGVRELRSEDLE